jgi:uncharacterized protein
MLVTDCHVHIEPFWMMKPSSAEMMKGKRKNFAEVEEFSRDAAKFLAYMDGCGVDRVVLINYAAQPTLGFPDDVNDWILKYCAADPEGLLPCGGLHPKLSENIEERMNRFIDRGMRLFKVHPPHQLVYPNEYLSGCKGLEAIYRTAESAGVPVMIHTGTSVFPEARSKYGDPIYVDDVAVDFPKLKILLAHGGRPLWMETAFFLVRRHANLFLDISGIPPRSLLGYFPRLQEIATTTLFGTDWPGPGVPDIKRNLDDFRGLEISEPAKRAILSENALEMWPK